MSAGALLDQILGRRALVVGDLMLDEYIFGTATRISQEAPVMVIRQSGTRAVPGAAANVAANMLALGAQVKLIGVAGDDIAGKELCDALERIGIGAEGVITEPGRPTTRKTRVLANHAHQVVRIDHETTDPVGPEVEAELLERAISGFQGVDVVLISDYLKGCVSGKAIRELVAAGARLGVPVVANPKPKSLRDYRGANLVSLNRFETADFLGWDTVADADGPRAAAEVRESLGVEHVLVTLGASGIASAGPDGTHFVPAQRVEVYDEAGAGDTVIGTIALGAAAGVYGSDMLGLAVRTAAAVVRKVGVAVPSPEDLAQIRAE